jgi:hypothetical protein
MLTELHIVEFISPPPSKLSRIFCYFRFKIESKIVSVAAIKALEGVEF